MANTVIALKKSATPSAAPTNLANGELAINFADGKLYYKAANGTISSISGNQPNYFGTVNANNTLVVADTPGDILTIVPGTNISIVGDAIGDKITIDIKNSPTFIGDTTVSGGGKFIAGAVGGDEGGEILLEKPPSGTLNGGITIDAYQDKLRIFEQGGSARGVYINLASALAGVGTDLLSSSSGTDSTARATAGQAFDKANTANITADRAWNHANAAFANGNTTIQTAQSAFTQANLAFIHANNAFASANAGQSTANAAFNRANTANITADRAWNHANAAFASANVAFANANTVMVSAQAAFTVANSSFLHSNAVYAFANSITVIANLAFAHANAAHATANAAFDKANSTTYTSNVVISVADNTNAALRITQTGTADAIRIEDETNPDATPFIVDTTGRLILGGTSTETSHNAGDGGKIQIQGGGGGPNGLSIYANTDSVGLSGAIRQHRRRRTGTGAVLTGDTVAGQQFSGYSGTTYRQAAALFVTIDSGTVDDTSMPGRITLQTSANGSITPTSRLEIDSSGNVTIGRTGSTVGSGVKLDVVGAANASNLLVNGNMVFTHANDGSGSNLDADLLDGQHGSYYGIATDVTASFAHANAAFANANTVMISAQAAFTVANSSFLHSNAVYAFSNSIAITANLAFAHANLAFANGNTVIQTAQSAFNQANLAFIHANNAFASANAGQASGNAAQSTANAAFNRANTANITADLAFNKANSALPNTSGVSFNGNLFFPAGSNVGIGITSSLGYALRVSGETSLDDHTTGATGNNWVQTFFGQHTFAFNSKFKNIGGTGWTRGATGNASAISAENVGLYFFTSANGTAGESINSNANKRMLIDYSGNVSIGRGVALPEYKLDVQGTVNASNILVNQNMVWHSGNDGTGSNLDADFLDGQHGSYYGIAADVTAAFLRANTANITSDRAWNHANAAFASANIAFANANTVMVSAQAAFTVANSGFVHANAAYAFANSIAITANLAFAHANVAFANGNTVIQTAQSAFNQANLAFIHANNAFASSNADYAFSNSAHSIANLAFTHANNAYAQANAAFLSSNGVNTYTNSTYVKLTAPNQTITGDLEIVGILTLSGNTVFIDATRLQIDDPLIYLAGNNYTSDIVDIGFIANYVNATGQNVHTGLYREHENKEYYLFQGYDKEPANNHIGAFSNNMTLAVLNADIKTSNLILGGVNAISTIGASFNHANAAHASANAGMAIANGAFASANAGQSTANAAFNRANTANITADRAWNHANAAFATANIAFANANTVMISAQAAFTVANSGFLHANSGYAFANSIAITANLAFAHANLAFANANTVMISAQATFTVANSGFIHANSGYAFANSIAITANLAFAHANLAFANGNTVIQTAQAAFTVANSGFLHANAAFIQANAAIASASAGQATGNAAYAFSNSAHAIANLAFTHANGAFAKANAALANTAGISTAGGLVIPGILTANTGGGGLQMRSGGTNDHVYIEYYPRSATSGRGAYVGYGSAATNNFSIINETSTGTLQLGTASSADITVTAAGDVGVGRADPGFKLDVFGTANASNLLVNGNMVFTPANDGAGSNLDADFLDGQHGSYYGIATDVTAAFLRANTANITADRAWNHANAAFASANIAFANANTVMISAQAAFTVANSGFLHANSGYAFANSIAVTANLAFAHANLAFANGNTVIQTAQSAFNQANLAFIHANAAFAKANTSGGGGSLNVASDIINATRYLMFANGISGSVPTLNVSTGMTFNPSTNNMSIAGNLSVGTTSVLTAGAGRAVVSVSGPSGSYVTLGTAGAAVGSVFADTNFGINGSTGIFYIINSAANQPIIFQTGASFTERMRIDPAGNVVIGASSTIYKLEVAGSFAAQTKSFVINHPTKPDMKLRYGSLEGPENGVYVRGRVHGPYIYLPDYWSELVDENSITVSLTPIAKTEMPSVLSYNNQKIVLHSNSSIDCFYHVFGERKDVDKLIVEF